MHDDYVKRSDVHKAFQPKYAPAINRAFAAMIDSVPSADVVEVVRCADCVYRISYGCKRIGGISTPSNWYCATGERKDGGHDEIK